jgi:hypothetical protein
MLEEPADSDGARGAVTRADPRKVAIDSVAGLSGAWMLALVATMSLILGALAGPVGQASGPAPAGTTPISVTASLGDAVPGSVILPPARGHAMQAVTWLWWIPTEQLLAAALLASMLLAVAGFTGPPVRSHQAPPPGRGPPQVAFPR